MDCLRIPILYVTVFIVLNPLMCIQRGRSDVHVRAGAAEVRGGGGSCAGRVRAGRAQAVRAPAAAGRAA